jgi:ABC-type transporter Mla maintaining outer membrane lipid asymmetry ATPase subunit MlaF
LTDAAPLPGDTPASSPTKQEVVISVRGLVVGFGDKLVMNGLDLDLYRGEVLGFVGASGGRPTSANFNIANSSRRPGEISRCSRMGA